MSNEVQALVKRRVVGSGTKKTILAYMADAASDDGSGIWTSKANIAADLEISTRAVQINIAAILDAGLLVEVGQKKCRRGYTIEYNINLAAVLLLPPTRERDSPLPQHVGGESRSPLNDVHPTPEPGSPLPLNDVHPNHPFNHNRTLCSADADHTQDLDLDFLVLVAEFERIYPRMGDAEKTEGALTAAIGDGADPREILAGAKAYAAENADNRPQYLKFSENWINEKLWTRHRVKPRSAVDPQKILEIRATDIREAKPWVCRSITGHAAGECITAGPVSFQDCKNAGIAI